MRTTNELGPDEKFRPKGATAFFILLIIAAAAVWESIFFIMLNRQ